MLLLMGVALFTTKYVKEHKTSFDKNGFEKKLLSYRKDIRDEFLNSENNMNLLSEDVDITDDDTNALREKTLFRVDRTENELSDAHDKKIDKPKNINFELIGIGKLGPIESAIILISKARSRRTRRSSSGKKTEPEKRTTKHVYLKGQVVGSSGYILEEINITSVKLLRGTDELILSLDNTDVASAKRSTAAAIADAKKEKPIVKPPVKKKKVPVKKTKIALRPPPPPPPPPGANFPPMPSIGRPVP